MGPLIKLFCIFNLLVLVGCSGVNRQSDTPLYERLGGETGVTHIVDNLLFEIGKSDLLSEKFNDTDIDRFRTKLIEHFCHISGGPCDYTGDPMPEVHAGLGLGAEHFDALVIALVAALDDAGVSTAAKNELLHDLAAMYDEVMRDTSLSR